MKRFFLAAVLAASALVISAVPAAASVDSTNTVVVGIEPWGVAISPDGATVYVVNRDAALPSVSFIDAASHTVLQTLALTGLTNLSAYGIAVTPDGSKIVVSSPANDSISTVLTSAPYTQTVFPIGANTPLQIAITADSQFAFVTSNAGNVLAKIGIGSSVYQGHVPVSQSPVGIARRPGTNDFYAVGQDGNSVTVINGTSFTVNGTIALTTQNPYGIAFTPDGTTAFVSDPRGNQVAVVSMATQAQTAIFPVGTYPQGIAVSDDGTKLYVANSGADTVEVYDTASYAKLETAPTGFSPTEIAVSPADESIWVTNYSNNNVQQFLFSWPAPTPPSPTSPPTEASLANTGNVTAPLLGIALLAALSGLVILKRNNRVPVTTK